MNLIETLQAIIYKLECLGLKESNATFSFYNDGIFCYETVASLSDFSANEPTKIELRIIADSSFFKDMPILDILNSKRVSYVMFVIMHQDENEKDLNVSFDDNWDVKESIFWKKENIAELN